MDVFIKCVRGSCVCHPFSVCERALTSRYIVSMLHVISLICLINSVSVLYSGYRVNGTYVICDVCLWESWVLKFYWAACVQSVLGNFSHSNNITSYKRHKSIYGPLMCLPTIYAEAGLYMIIHDLKITLYHNWSLQLVKRRKNYFHSIDR